MLPVILIKPLFTLGKIVVTANASAKVSHPDILEGLQRHAAGDWGAISAADAQSNEESLQDGEGFHSVYGEGSQEFWIITDADRSVTTILLPEDY